MEEITFQVQRDEQSGFLTAWWDDSDGAGGITTQGQDLRDLQQQITEAVGVHFEEGCAPRRIRIRQAGPRWHGIWKRSSTAVRTKLTVFREKKSMPPSMKPSTRCGTSVHEDRP
jgi:hypothetical protein